MTTPKHHKVLHVTNWYPSPEKPYDAIWIQRHIQSIQPYVSQQVLHLEVQPGNKFRFRNGRYADGVKYCILTIPLKPWVFTEIASSALLFYFLVIKRMAANVHLLNFHIAYPLLVHWHLLKFIIRKPVVVNEHYSAYHFSFNITNERKKEKIKKIFKNDLMVLSVSESLQNDIEKFCGFNLCKKRVLPNIVSSEYSFEKAEIAQRFFFMLTNFKYPKRPEIVIDAFLEFRRDNPSFKLYLGGVEANDPKLKGYSSEIEFLESVYVPGRLESSEIKDFMNNATAFLHCSDYETFSVVCAEALACGAPVIASKVGGITELVNMENGILVSGNTKKDWLKELNRFVQIQSKFDREKISIENTKKFSQFNIGLQYWQSISDYLKNNGE